MKTIVKTMVKIIVKTVVNTMASNRENRGEKQVNSISLRFQLERHSHIFHLSFHFRFHFSFQVSFHFNVVHVSFHLNKTARQVCRETQFSLPWRAELGMVTCEVFPSKVYWWVPRNKKINF